MFVKAQSQEPIREVVKPEPILVQTADGEMKVVRCPVCGNTIIVEPTMKARPCRECGGTAKRYGTDPRFLTRSKIQGKVVHVRATLRTTHNPEFAYGK